MRNRCHTTAKLRVDVPLTVNIINPHDLGWLHIFTRFTSRHVNSHNATILRYLPSTPSQLVRGRFWVSTTVSWAIFEWVSPGRVHCNTHPGVAAEAGAPDSCGGCDVGRVSTVVIDVATAVTSSHLRLASRARSRACVGLLDSIFSMSDMTVADIFGTSWKSKPQCSVYIDLTDQLYILDRLPVLRTWGTAFVHGRN